MKNFGCGNKEILLEPKNVHKVLRDFHSEHYVASAMTVGLECMLPLDVQKELVQTVFSELPVGQRKIVRETPPKEKDKKIMGKRAKMHYVVQGLSSFSNVCKKKVAINIKLKADSTCIKWLSY